MQLFREFQTVGAVQRKARSAKCVLVVGFCSSRCDEERRWHVDILGLMWWLRYDGVPVLRTASMYSMFCLSVGLLSDSARFLLQHPFSGTPCHWTFSHHPLYPFFVNSSRHFFSVNLPQHFTVTFCFHRTRSRGLSNSFTIWATLKIAIKWLTDWLNNVSNHKYIIPCSHKSEKKNKNNLWNINLPVRRHI